MKENTLVSIIVPVYNAEQFLSRCIESILYQTYTNFELLLVDDGSTDESGRICDEYSLKDARIKVYHKPNGGVSSARNYGLLKIEGGYLTFVDSDDFLDKEHIQTMIEYVPAYDWVMSSRIVVDDNGEKLLFTDHVSEKIEAHGEKQVDETCMKTPLLFVYVTNKLYKTAIIKEYGIQFIQESYVHEDGLFNYNYVQHVKSFVMLPKASYYCLANPNSITHSRYTDLHMFIYSAEAINDLLKGNELGKKISLHAAQYQLNFYLRTALGCIYYPLHILSLKQRILIIKYVTESIRNSVLISRYRKMIPQWLFFRAKHYLKKFTRRFCEEKMYHL